jgi:ParB family chromosome partitioning protein
MKRKALGRGLSAILSDKNIQPAPIQDDSRKVQEIAVGLIRVNHMQPRTEFIEDELAELAESIRQQGVLQPLLVRKDPNDENSYQLIAGERRLRASKRVENKTVPCIVLDAEESQMLEIALIENIQRSNLNPVEESRAYRLMSEQSNLTQDQIAKKVGKSRAAIANSIRLLNLPKDALEALEQGQITVGHAKLILSVDDQFQQNGLTQHIIVDDLSVRETEKFIQEYLKHDKTNAVEGSQTPKPKALKPEEDQHIKDLRHRLETNWNTKVQLKMSGKNKGKIEIQFYDLDHLDDLLRKWNIKIG